MSGNRWKNVTLEERLLAKIETGPMHTDGTACWNWTGAATRKGYGQVYRNGRRIQATHASYELYVGPVPEGLELDHLCRNPRCINPLHLEPVTGRENLLRGNGWAGRNARKTNCPQGHEYTPANTIMEGTTRRCRTCKNARAAADRAADTPEQREVRLEKLKVYSRRHYLRRKHAIDMGILVGTREAGE